MPGIFGVIDTSPLFQTEEQRRDRVETVQKMSRAMRYEPFHSEVVIACPGVGACVGRVGFDEQNRQDEAGLDPHPVVLTTGEALPGLCEQSTFTRDVAMTPGHSSGFVSDPAAGRCFLFNDRYGRERIFLHSEGGRIFFSSEAKAILAVVPQTRSFDPQGLAEMLACGCTLGTRSLFHGIEVLEAGTLVTFEKSGAVTRSRYFGPRDLEGLEPASDSQFLEGFVESLRVAVNKCTRNNPPVGISLTGGLDSRMIMASLRAPRGSVPCYTFGSMYRTSADVAVGRRVAACSGQPHHVLELGEDFLSSFERNIEQSVYVSDGYLGLSGAAELYVNRLARAVAPARMTGNWGGELMRGVRAFKYQMPKGAFVGPELANGINASAAAFSTTSSNPISNALFQQMPFQGYGRYAIERSQVVMRSPFLADDVVTWLYRASPDLRASSVCTAAVIGQQPGLLAIPSDLGRLGTRPALLRHASRRALIKAEYLTSHGAPDWVAKLSAGLPPTLVETRFLGVDKFQHFRHWIRRDLAEFVRETLLGTSGRYLERWFELPTVNRMVNDHIDGRANHTDAIDKLLTVAMAQKTLFKHFEGA